MKFIHHSQEVNVADGVDIDVKVNIQFLPEVLFRFFSLQQLKIFKNNSTLKPVSVIPVSVSSLTSFFFVEANRDAPSRPPQTRYLLKLFLRA